MTDLEDPEDPEDLEEFLVALAPTPRDTTPQITEESRVDPSVIDGILRHCPAAAQIPRDRLEVTVQAIVGSFEYWYARVMRESARGYRKQIVSRINPLVRQIEYDGRTPHQAAALLVEEYRVRNLVTAGGWAVEEAAIAICPSAKKASAAGMDIERLDETGTTYLYQLKAGILTANYNQKTKTEDHFRAIHKLHNQSLGTVRSVLSLASAFGRPRTTEVDGVRKLASSLFWAEMTGLGEIDALGLMATLFEVSGRIGTQSVQPYIEHLTRLVAIYIADPDDPAVIDWSFLMLRNTRARSEWRAHDRHRHQKAIFLQGQ